MGEAETGETENPTAPDRVIEENADRLASVRREMSAGPPGGRGDLGWQGSGLTLWEHNDWNQVKRMERRVHL
jgi:hypothetical protein